MTDETTTPANVTIVTAQVADDKGVIAEGAIAAEGDHALIVARFADTESAIAVYDNLLVPRSTARSTSTASSSPRATTTARSTSRR